MGMISFKSWLYLGQQATYYLQWTLTILVEGSVGDLLHLGGGRAPGFVVGRLSDL